MSYLSVFLLRLMGNFITLFFQIVARSVLCPEVPCSVYLMMYGGQGDGMLHTSGLLEKLNK